MKLHVLALSLAFIAAPALAEEPAVQGEVLAADFVEVGNLPPGLSRDLAMVELVNATGLPLTAAVGEGTASLAKDDRLTMRVAPGELAVLVTAIGRADLRLEGRIMIERARRYGLEVFIGVPESEQAEPLEAPPAGKANGVGRRPPEERGGKPGKMKPAAKEAESEAPAAEEAKEPVTEKAQPVKTPRRTGKVDIGRKRPRDRK